MDADQIPSLFLEERENTRKEKKLHQPGYVADGQTHTQKYMCANEDNRCRPKQIKVERRLKQTALYQAERIFSGKVS